VLTVKLRFFAVDWYENLGLYTMNNAEQVGAAGMA
jgi:hypothetical protein